MKKNWIRLLTMLLAAMLILTMSGVVSLANDDQPVTGDGVSDVSDTISPVKTEEEPSVDESSTGASSEDEGSKGPSSEDVSSEGSSSEDASSKDASSKDASSKDASSEDISSEECTCGATEGEVHKEGCPLYTEPEEKPSEAVQAVIDMIEALPDTDTVANYEPAVDLPEDDEGYNDAYNEAYSAYLEEAKENYAAAQEAYNALTDEEKAEIPEELTGKLVDFAGFIAMLGQVNTLDLDNASGGPEYYEEFGTKKAPFFFANGTPITITETGADGMGAKITWDGGEKDVPANTNVFGGYHNSDTSCTTSIIMIGGRLNSLFGGGLHKSHVTKATITISGGAVPGQVAGGGASSMTNGCSDDCSYTNAWYSGDAKDSPCRVDEAVVTIEGGNDYLLVFGGGEGISSTGTATLNISGGDMSGAYVTAGGSNGYTGSGTVNVSGSANIKVLQGVNRGGMDAIKLNVTGGTVKNMYAGGESGDASVTGTFAQSDVTVSGGTVKTLRAGTNGGAEITDMSGITATITPSAVEDNQLTDKLVAEVSGVDYPSLDAAVKAAKNGDVIKLLSGYTAETADDIVTIPEGLSITLDLAGKTIDVGSSFAGRPLINRGTLTITGNGTIDSSASLSGRGAIDNYGTITIENGTYTGNVYADGASLMNRQGSTAIINGGTFNGATSALYNEGKVTVNNGSFITTSCTHVVDAGGKQHWSYALNSRGELYFNNGTVQGVQGALSISSGYAEVKKGTFTTVKDTEGNDACAYYAIYIAGEVGEVEAHVYGGTFKSASKVAILVGNDNTGGDGGINAKATAYISGGTFIGGNGKALDAGTNTGNPSITGGTFNSDVTKYVAAGYVCEQQGDGSYKVSPGASIAQIGSTVYPSLAAAITDAVSGDTITLLADVKEDPVTVDRAVTIDGNGKEFTGTMVVSAGGVTIKNTVFTGAGIVPKEGKNGANHLIKVTCDGTFTFTGNTIRGVDAKTADGQDGIYYDYINIAASGVVTITGNTFDANGGKVYNGIECSQSIPLASGSKIANNTFAKGDCTHNSINIYKVADGGSYDVSGNTFAYSGNAFRLSNYPNADGASPRATFNMNNTTYNETDTTNPGYAGLICLQDPTNQNGKFEDFSKFTIHLANLKGPGGEILTKNELGTAKQVFYVYRDKTGIIEDAAQWPVVPEFINTDEEIAEVVAAAIKAGNDALKAALGDGSTTTLADVTEDDIKAIILSDKGAAFKTAIGEASAMLDKLDAGKLAAYLAKNPDLNKQVDALRMSYDIAFTVAPAPSVPEVKATVPADATDAEKQAFNEAKGELAADSNPAATEPPKNLAEAVKGNLPAEATEAALANNTTEIHVSLETEIHDIAVQEVTNDDGTTTAVVTEIKFEVQPVWLIKAGDDVKAKGAIDSLSGQPVTFKLPIPKSVTDRYAKIVHEYSGGSETFYLEIQKDEEGNQYVDVTVTHFSPFVVTFTNSKPSSGHSSSGGGSGGGSASLDNYDFWAKVQKSIERADGGDVIKANASKALNVPGSVLRALEGRDVTLVISYKGRELAIYGKNMPSIPDNKVYYTFDDLFDLFADYDATVLEIPEAKPGSNPVTGGGYYLPGVTVPTVTLTAELPAVPETPDRISLEPAEKAVEPAVPAEAAPAQASAPAAAHRRLSGVTIALAALIAAVAVGGITTGVWLYKRREQE